MDRLTRFARVTMLRLGSLLRRSRAERELRQEIAFHFENLVQEGLDSGLDEKAARARAQREFGSVDKATEECRDARGVVWIENLVRDLRYAARGLARDRGFTAVAVVTLALGIGTAGAMFSLADAVWLRPLPYPDPGRLVNIWLHNPAYPHLDLGFDPASAAVVRRAPALAASAEYATGPAVWRSGGRRSQAGFQANVALVSRELFPLLGASVAAPTGQKAVVSLRLAERLGGPRRAIGTTISSGGMAFTVAGVAPAGFDFPALVLPGFPAKTDIWIALSKTHERLLTGILKSSTSVLARLRRGANRTQLQAQLGSLDAKLPAGGSTRLGPRWHLAALPLVTETVGQARAPLAILFAAAMLLWLMAAVNVAHLLLERGWRRGGEIGLRRALGASPAAIVRFTLAEALLLSAVGSALGLALTYGALYAPRICAPAGWLPATAHANGPLGWFVLATALTTGLAAGWWPARQSVRRDPQALLRGVVFGLASSGKAAAKARRALLVAESALAVVLLASALVLVRSFTRIANTPVGLRTRNVVTAFFSAPPSSFSDSRQQLAFYRQLLRRCSAMPGVAGVALTGAPVLAGMTFVEPPVHTGAAVVADFHHRAVTPGYFRLLGVPLLRGRDFSSTDQHGAPEVAIVNRTFVREAWPNGADPIGQQLVVRWHGQSWSARVIGVADDARDNRLRVAAPAPEIYTSLLQDLPPSRAVGLLLRTRGSAAAEWPHWRHAVLQQVWSVAEDAPVSFLQPLSAVVAQNRAGPRFRSMILAAFALLGLVLAAVGIYGAFAYAAEQRRREFGIRLALGATGGDLIYMAMSATARVVAAGLALGLAAAWLAVRGMAHWLYGVPAGDPLPFATAAGLLAAAALVAAYLPLRRSLHLNLARTLREP